MEYAPRRRDLVCVLYETTNSEIYVDHFQFRAGATWAGGKLLAPVCTCVKAVARFAAEGTTLLCL